MNYPKITASIVLYNSSSSEVKRLINCLLNCRVDVLIYLVDNSPEDTLKSLADSNKVEYYHNPKNPGYGTSHNFAMKKAQEINSDYHFVLNPDVYFEEDVVTAMVEYMMKHSEIGMMMPEILNKDGTLQNLPKLLPSPFSIVMRKIKKPKLLFQKFINEYELRFVNRKTVYNAPVISGCFTLFCMNAIKEVGMYDEQFFMYFEDWDLSRRMHQKYETVYFPKVSAFHGYHSGANKNKFLFKVFVASARKYFNKWGWFTDPCRALVNQQTLNQFK